MQVTEFGNRVVKHVLQDIGFAVYRMRDTGYLPPIVRQLGLDTRRMTDQKLAG